MTISQPVRENLLAIADAYVKATGLSPTTVSRKFYGNQKFFDDFRSGECSITVPKLEEVVQKFSDEWPAGLRWPKVKPILMDRPPQTSAEKNL